mmetsp:Transcript_16741/g.29827  ORF Transcript_16741/g.29827 Transcript_16741/m.29827 type:complete len:246 (+) Transcript_16741:88-825(+)
MIWRPPKRRPVSATAKGRFDPSHLEQAVSSMNASFRTLALVDKRVEQGVSKQRTRLTGHFIREASMKDYEEKKMDLTLSLVGSSGWSDASDDEDEPVPDELEYDISQAEVEWNRRVKVPFTANEGILRLYRSLAKELESLESASIADLSSSGLSSASRPRSAPRSFGGGAAMRSCLSERHAQANAKSLFARLQSTPALEKRPLFRANSMPTMSKANSEPTTASGVNHGPHHQFTAGRKQEKSIRV